MTPEEINQKAIEYAKLEHKEEYDDPAFARDVSETVIDFTRGYAAALAKVAEMRNKAIGVDAFCDRLDKIFEMGDPTKAQIVDAYNKSVAEMPTEEEIRKEFPIGSTEKMKYNSDYAEQMKENQYKRLGALWFRNRMSKPNTGGEG